MSTDSQKSAQQKAFEVEVEVPGTPEEIWQAIATGPGVTLWFTKMEIEERLGGKVVADPNQPIPGRVTIWEPPHTFAYEYPETAGPHAWEFTVEAQDGGTCKVRLVDSFYVIDSDWSNEIPTGPDGWTWAFQLLVMNQTHFPGQLGASVQAMWPVPGTFAESWAAMREQLGMPEITVGTEVTTAGTDAPALAGTVVSYDGRVAIVKLGLPAPGLAWLATGGGSEDKSHAMVHINLFGPDAATVAAREQPLWQAWLQRTFPLPAPAKAEAAPA